MPSSTVSITVLALGLFSCSKSSSERSEVGSAAPPAGSATPSSVPADASAESATAATVVGPTKSAAGSLELAGAITGTFEWKKKDQRSPITCVWDPAKEIGTIRVDVSDGAGKLVTLAVDIPPTDAGTPRLEVSSKALAAPSSTQFGFNVSGDDATLVTVKFDAKLGADENKPDLTVKGTLEVSCPKR